MVRFQNVVIIDSHPVVAAGLQSTLEDGMIVIAGTATSVEKGIELVSSLDPAVIVIDPEFGGVTRFDLIRECRIRASAAAIVLFTGGLAALDREAARAAGAAAVLDKRIAPLEVAAAIRSLLAERLAGSPLGKATADQRTLLMTRRERELARLLSRGLPIGQIAALMGVSPKTAAVHRDNLRKKLKCRDSNELIARLARAMPHHTGAANDPGAPGPTRSAS